MLIINMITFIVEMVVMMIVVELVKIPMVVLMEWFVEIVTNTHINLIAEVALSRSLCSTS